MLHSLRNNVMSAVNILFHVHWPPRWCYLKPLDYFLWDYDKAHIYRENPASIDALENNIEAFICEIPAEMLGRVCQNCTKQMDYLRRSRG